MSAIVWKALALGCLIAEVIGPHKGPALTLGLLCYYGSMRWSLEALEISRNNKASTTIVEDE